LKKIKKKKGGGKEQRIKCGSCLKIAFKLPGIFTLQLFSVVCGRGWMQQAKQISRPRGKTRRYVSVALP
jgi:hypothetical protein